MLAPFQTIESKSLKHSFHASAALWAPVHFTIHTRCIGVPTVGVFGLVADQQTSDRCAYWVYGVRTIPCECALVSFTACSHVYERWGA